MRIRFARAVSACLCAVPLALSGGCGGSADDANDSVNGTIALAWDNSGQAAGYKLYYGTASRSYAGSVDTGALAPSSGGTLQFTITGLAPGRTYYISATAYNASRAESAYSNEVSGVAR